MNKIILTLEFFLFTLILQAQSNSLLTSINKNWYNKDLIENKLIGTSVDKSYKTILPNLQIKDTVVVAVIDVGVDINHEDLKGKIWINKNEIENNGIDDDNNGYIDDIHGWNFLGNSSGQNILHENYEFTRIVRENKNDSNYVKAKKIYDLNLKIKKEDSVIYHTFYENCKKVKTFIYEKTGVKVNSYKDLISIDLEANPSIYNARKWLISKYKNGYTEDDLSNRIKNTAEHLNYHLNINYDPRNIINDDINNLNDHNYGNNDVKGPHSFHGTGVAGIIAANRNNNIGIDGIASNVKIMSLRIVPDGDERDKDIALAIIYAVDNGAKVINMSFGKSFSPNKSFVDSAVTYAEKHNVLLVHASGNDGINLDKFENYPSGYLLEGRYAENWISVGANEMRISKYLPADFSNYGKNNVDIFAPGKAIVSLDTSNTYSINSGTSFAAPVVSGIAALILSYYPDLKPNELKDILLKGAFKTKKSLKVYLPNRSSDENKKTYFDTLSKCGGIVNAYNSFLILMEKENKTLP